MALATLLQSFMVTMKVSVFIWIPLLLFSGMRVPANEPLFTQAQPSPRTPVRTEAADLFSLAQFVEWPDDTARSARATFNFCVLGRDPFSGLLDDSILSHSIDDRPTMVVHGNRIGDMGRCDVLFVSSSEVNRVPKILREVRYKQILTVSETANFATNGGIVQFLEQADRIGFAINVDAAKRAGLTIRAPLLALAQIVHDDAATPRD